MKPFIAIIPPDDFFPERYSVDRGDGNRTHPSIGREWCDHVLSKAGEEEGKHHWILAKRDKQGRPYAEVCSLSSPWTAQAGTSAKSHAN